MWGYHTVEAYSNWRLTRVLYATDLRSLLWTRIFLLRKPRVWFAFFVVMSICLDHERSSAMVTPKYFAAGTLSSSTLCRMYLVLRGFVFYVIWRTWHLEGLNCISHIFPIVRDLLGLFVGTSLFVVELIARYKAVSLRKVWLWIWPAQAGHLCMQERELGENRALLDARGDWDFFWVNSIHTRVSFHIIIL